MYAIQTEGLTKQYSGHAVVEEVSLHVHQGEIYGFLGLNGAGKTTTIRMLLGMIRANRGFIRVLGQDVSLSKGPWAHIGYMVETPAAYPDLSVLENLQVVYRMRNMKDKSRLNTIIKQLNLSKYRDIKAKHLSLGNVQRLGIAKALMHRPELLILDEPINGLDPAGIVEIRELLRNQATQYGTTVFVSSHILNEVSRLASRIGIINNGRLLTELDLEDLQAAMQKRLLVETVNNAKALAVLQAKGIEVMMNERQQLQFTSNTLLKHPENIATVLVGAGVPPKAMITEEEDLETYFLRIITNNYNEPIY